MRIARVYTLAAAVGFPVITGAFLLTLQRTLVTADLIEATDRADLLSRESVRLAEAAHRLAEIPDQARRAMIAEQMITRARALAALAARSSGPLEVDAIVALAGRLLTEIDIVRAAAATGGGAAAALDQDGLLDAITALNESVHEMVRPVFTEARHETVRVRATVLAAGAGLSIVLIVLWIYVHIAVIRPLERLAAAMERAGDGDLSLRVDDRATNEVGDIARAFNRMTRNLSRLTASRAELEAEIARREALEADLIERHDHLLEIKAELDKFAYIASHDLRAPLRAIRNIAAWIEEDASDRLPADAARLFALMRSRVARLDTLLDALLEYTRIGRVAPPVEAVDLRALVVEAAQICDPAGAFAVTYGSPDVTLATHRGALDLVLRHLVGNAVKHHDREGGRVTVTAAIEGERCRIRVVDDGPGVPDNMKKRIFEMFQTLRPRDEVEGSGMGLALVRKIARLYGSEVTVESPVADGRGSAFSVAWPCRTPEKQPAGAPAPRRGEGGAPGP